MTKSNIIILSLGLLCSLVAYTLAGAVGKAELLEEQIVDLQDTIVTVRAENVILLTTKDSVVALTPIIEAEAAQAIEQATAEFETQQAASEAAFRRAVALAEDDLVLERAIEEMRAEAIVESMEAEEALAISAASLLRSQLQTRDVTTAFAAVELGLREELTFTNNALDLAVQRGDILERALAPGFFQKFVDNIEVVGITIGVTAIVTYVATR